MQFRMYLDSTKETLSYFDNIDEPFEYVKQTPLLFHKWVDWAKIHKPSEGDVLRPMGDKMGPSWMRCDFEDLNAFYEFYISLLEDFRNNG